MKTKDFDFDLPKNLIAQFPSLERTSSRLLYVNSSQNNWQDALFVDLPGFVKPGDVMIFNDTQVLKARLFGKKDSGGKIEVMIERIIDEHHAIASIRASHAPKTNSKLFLAGIFLATVIDRSHAFYRLYFEHERSVVDLLEAHGQLPLPPYITRPATKTDEARYQTVYAKNPGSVAAPTAGLHFDSVIMTRLRDLGVRIAYVTLHVGAGTYQPVRVEHIKDHAMHSETFHIPQEVDAIQRAKKCSGRIIAIGTTSLRALEACVQQKGALMAGYGETNIFITPGYHFKIVERLFTNFHLPCSTLLMLVSAFAGVDTIKRAYQHAIQQRYRFFSYGDAMLIERNHEI